MHILFDILTTLLLLLLLIGSFHYFRLRRIALSRVLHLIDALAAGQYSRRVDEKMPGLGGELAKATNSLAEKLEARSAQAQLDSDHLVSLLAVLDHSNEIAIATDSSDVIRLVNPMASRVLGKPVEQLLNRSIKTVVHNPDLLALHKNAFHSAKPISAQITLQSLENGEGGNGGGGRMLHCQATAATIYSGPHYRGTLLLLRDVTEIARTFQIKTDFVANASHELRTPLASIRAAVETIQSADDLTENETIRRCVDIINSHTLRLQLIITDLLDLSRTEDPRALVRADMVNLPSLCELVMSMYAGNAAEKHILLRAELAPNARSIRGDERLLVLMLKNLIDNAVKFTASGTITIRSYLSESSPTGDVVLEVQDTGCGIPLEDQQRVFERFYTVNRSRGGADRGTGLGLAIVKHSVAAMGGQVALLSELNKGTTIRCSFPQPRLN
ncbi:MAG: ATP-binding protein [Phycisphaerales bacterium]|nr:ATP-binding protein [Phycisphaerales bacterium]